MEENKKLGQEPAFQVPTNCSLKRDKNDNIINCPEDGMSKRFYAACAAMQGMLANMYTGGNGYAYSETIDLAYKYADELLSQENL